ncbi:carboxymethylenebutenolidase [Hyphopichia burtonii NRRL Y-1933]|uniref:Carboxymethylenebutenolidase n=1 Tax=Hyphopichia burtonii NRRL Y-1933 TaxID=984485 RepID=A0A1E4RQQ9_9ASCO|nr:carboxymethylenebutenolidase [Hyphopichia burtonii NRRL Y-1933]ODV69541.1 carboxymethylenebutenolidase [Hyphopichia burtonii NRRL Y-1933]
MLIKESYHDVKTSYGTTMRIFVYHPTIPNYPNVKFPGVVVHSEIYQVTGPVSRFAKDIAGQGFIVACPSIFHNFESHEPLAYDVEGTDKGNKYKITKELKSFDEDNKLTIDYLCSLPTCNGSIGSLGMCLGGHVALRTSFDKRVKAAVCFFATDIHNHALGLGQNDDTLQRIKEIKGEIIMIFGCKDNHVPPEGRDLIRGTFRENNIDMTFIEINDAQHAFIRDELSKGRYDPATTKNCMEFLFELFNRKLKLEYGDHDGQKEVIENVC